MRIEGRNAVLEALRSGVKARKVQMLRDIKPSKSIDEILHYLQAQNIRAEFVQRQELDRNSEHNAHQGVIIWTAPFEYTPLGQIIDAAVKVSNPLIVVLDHVTDPGNLGAIVRSAEVFGAVGMVVAKDRAATVTPAAFKAAAGALSHLPLAQVTNINRALERAKEAGFWVAGASEHAEEPAWEADLKGRMVLVMGAEGTGLSRLVQKNCDLLVKLPQSGKVNSLNVAQAATALMYEIRRQTQS